MGFLTTEVKEYTEMKKQYLKPEVVEHKLRIESMLLKVSDKTSAGWGNDNADPETKVDSEGNESTIPGVEGDITGI